MRERYTDKFTLVVTQETGAVTVLPVQADCCPWCNSTQTIIKTEQKKHTAWVECEACESRGPLARSSTEDIKEDLADGVTPIDTFCRALNLWNEFVMRYAEIMMVEFDEESGRPPQKRLLEDYNASPWRG